MVYRFHGHMIGTHKGPETQVGKLGVVALQPLHANGNECHVLRAIVSVFVVLSHKILFPSRVLVA